MPMPKGKAESDLKVNFGDLEFVPGKEDQNEFTDISKEVTKDPENSVNKPPKSSTLQPILFVGKRKKCSNLLISRIMTVVNFIL